MKESNIKVSVITPLYNSAKYLNEAVECILNQTLKDIEIIFIDDGSTDETNSIIKKYLNMDDRIVFLENKKNMGAAYSRNNGMEYARGKYLIFLDGDDVFLPELLEKLFMTAEKNKAQIVLCDYYQEITERIRENKYIKHNQIFYEKYGSKTFKPSELLPQNFEIIRTSLGGFFVLNTFIKENNIKFQDIRSSNDVFFTFFAQMIAQRVVWLKNEKVLWFQRIHNTESRISTKRNLMDEYQALIAVGEKLTEICCVEEALLIYLYRCCMYFLSNIRNEDNKFLKNQYYHFIINQGLEEIFKICKITDIKDVKELKNIFLEFQNNKFSNEWFKEWYEKNIGIEWHINNKLHELSRMISNKNVVLWGAGKNGEVLEQICHKNKLKIRMIVDGNDNKIGKIIGKHKVRSTELIKASDFIIITPFNCEEIEKACIKKGNEYICLTIFIDYPV